MSVMAMPGLSELRVTNDLLLAGDCTTGWHQQP